ncbi:unannotated protein [freshwater metagenome]|uniref:Unannotated protein n=1 Tax=freshwater metagenome TaxID=449393 RepID=A0A6J6V9T5_9ZZZZ
MQVLVARRATELVGVAAEKVPVVPPTTGALATK